MLGDERQHEAFLGSVGPGCQRGKVYNKKKGKKKQPTQDR